MLKHSLIALMAMGAGLLALPAAGAQAMPVQQPAAQADGNPLFTTARARYGDHVMMYDRHQHGDRCGSWSRHCSHYYHGYYYQYPWWTVPMVGAGIALGAGAYDRDYYDGGYGDRHVQWCMDRYRSYDPRSNTWVSYGGRVHQCISPYGP